MKSGDVNRAPSLLHQMNVVTLEMTSDDDGEIDVHEWDQSITEAGQDLSCRYAVKAFVARKACLGHAHGLEMFCS